MIHLFRRELRACGIMLYQIAIFSDTGRAQIPTLSRKLYEGSRHGRR